MERLTGVILLALAAGIVVGVAGVGTLYFTGEKDVDVVGERKAIAEEETRSVIDATLPEKYHPDTVRVGQRVISSGDATGTDYVYGFNWKFSDTVSDLTFWTGVYFHPNETRDPSTVHEVIWSVEGVTDRNVSVLDEKTARIILSDYVATAPRDLDCQRTTNDTLSCNSYWREKDTEQGILLAYLSQRTGEFQILGCKRTAESNLFGTGSCVHDPVRQRMEGR